jgi:threonylcarbamoyladenosine tRNA methylthiotransferase MtaB
LSVFVKSSSKGIRYNAPMKVHLSTLGCRLNEAEIEDWSEQLRQQGHAFDSADNADLVIINTCAVTQEASRKSRHLINRLRRDNPQAKLVVTGCHASLHTDDTQNMPGVDMVIPNDRKSALPEMIRDYAERNPFTETPADSEAFSLFQRNRHRAFIKVQDGCRYRCTFCIVTLARGEETSRSIEDIVNQIRGLHLRGIQEAVLTGVHVGGYGSDQNSNLKELISAILADTDIPRLRLASVEPWDLPADFFSLFTNPRLMPHMHLPLQSGADSVLRRMARRCKTRQFEALVDEARSAVSDFNATTDIIAGFPGETASEWQETIRFVEKVGFGHLHIFPYSPREGTKASTLPNQVPVEIKQQRCRELSSLGESMKHDFLSRMINSEQNVLWEKPERIENTDKLRYSGYTPNYARVETVVPEHINLEYHITPTLLSALHTERWILKATVNPDDYPASGIKPFIIPIHTGH